MSPFGAGPAVPGRKPPSELIATFLAAGLSWSELQRRLDAEPDPAWLQFALRIGAGIPVHHSPEIPSQSFSASVEAARAYLARVRTACLRPGEDWLSRRDGAAQAPARPPVSQPIYFIAVGAGARPANIVYVGQTSSTTGRFDNGHVAATRLNDPSYDGRPKRVHMCEVQVRIDEDTWVNIEFLRAGKALLTQLEAQLILQLDPVFNAPRTKDPRAGAFVVLHDNAQRLHPLDGMYLDPAGLQPLAT